MGRKELRDMIPKSTLAVGLTLSFCQPLVISLAVAVTTLRAVPTTRPTESPTVRLLMPAALSAGMKKFCPGLRQKLEVNKEKIFLRNLPYTCQLTLTIFVPFIKSYNIQHIIFCFNNFPNSKRRVSLR
jgi:hypothetical protein